MFETDLDLSRPWFSEIKVQIKRPIELAESVLHDCLVEILEEYFILEQNLDTKLSTSELIPL